MTITLYRSDDASAPTLTGQVGSLTTLLDAILVNGYGALAAAGWGIAYTATNKRAYRAAAGNRMYLQVDDTNALSAGANYARTVAYESMSAIATGTGPFPTSAQVSGGLFVVKSSTADSVTRPWWCIAGPAFFYFCSLPTVSFATGPTGSTVNDCLLAFGDFTSKKSGDAFNVLHIANPITGSGNSNGGVVVSTTNWTLTAGHFLPRPYTQISSSIAICKAPVRRSMSTGNYIGSDTGSPNFPDPITGGMLLSEVQILETGGTPVGLTRGTMPGMYEPNHNPSSLLTAYNNLDTIAGAGPFAGITFTLVRLPTFGAGNPANAAIQTTGTWP